VTPRRRAEVFEAVEAGMTVSAACLAFRVSRRWYYRWRPRWQAEGRQGMYDRSSRPLRSPQLVSRSQEQHVVLLRQLLGASADTIAALTGIPRSTVHRILRRRGLQRLKLPKEPVVRYEYAEPGAMVHVDTKKLGRIVDGPGHRIHGDRRLQRDRHVGWEVLHVAVDDCTRLVYCEVLPDEKGRTAAHFLIRAVRWFREQGITLDRLLTDNGSPYRSKAWRRVCRAAHVRHRCTRPYRPQTNGKVERWIQTALRECLYLWAFDSSDERRERLQAWVRWYNRHRPHRSLQGLPPTRRLAQLRAA
jgi:transposase InsO family protein